ncbi:MAG: family 16 glycosylhydrolase [Cryomorphaceae bacterium]|nr:family 16 glycosylhydrolase [Flavobacteriales bacterium]
MNSIQYVAVFSLLAPLVAFAQPQTVEDDFEGNGTIENWFGAGAMIDTQFENPVQEGLNPSATVMEYRDLGNATASAGFELDAFFDLSESSTFTLLIYVPSSSVTGSQPNQISLKLQNGNIDDPQFTETEIIREIVLDEWQTVSFDFANDDYINALDLLDDPVERTDLNRVILQVNGEGNTDFVRAYIDDFSYDGTVDPDENPAGSIYTELVWADEFDGEGAIASEKWHHQTQLPLPGGWYNGEVQHYTDRTENSFVEDGFLNIVAKAETYTDQGYTKDYTSARLNSKFAFTYGRVEARAKLPFGVGTWPAIWTLGKNIIEPGGYWSEDHGEVFWPECGEIDIMEHWGTDQNYVQSALHTPSSFGGTENHGGLELPDVSNTYHTYAMEWSADAITFSVDGIVFYTYEPSTQNAETWPFFEEQYILLNVAIQPVIQPGFTESAMEIDYVRVYQEPVVSTGNAPEKVDIKTFPNPASDILHVQVPEEMMGSRGRVLSIDGREVLGFIPTSQRWSIDLSALPAGCYILRLEGENGVASEKVVKR